VFFVLSGFVIEYTRPRHPDLIDYARVRLVRLWSVVIPALAYTALVDAISYSVNPSYYAAWLDSPISNSVSLFADSLFLNQSWSHELSFGSDNPIWSLGYEAAYYALFGAFVYLRGTCRIFVIAALIAIKGPQILVLLPVWLLGVVTCRIIVGAKGRANRLVSAAIALGICLVLLLFWFNHDVRSFLQKMPGGLGRSGFFGTLMVSGCATSAFILLTNEVRRFWAPLALAAGRPIRWLAGSTFSIYLFHLPTLVLIQAVTGYSRSAVVPKLMAFTLTVCLCIVLSLVTERRKSWWDGPVRRMLLPFAQVKRSEERGPRRPVGKPV
jgi:peptidoglycan/LPS O-acetylase OafA/YrhL